MNIDEKTLQQIESLAKLTVNDADKALTIKKIVGVLDMLDKINMDDIEGLEPLYHPLEISQPMRDDISDDAIERDKIQLQSPQTENGLFLVPKVIE